MTDHSPLGMIKLNNCICVAKILEPVKSSDPRIPIEIITLPRAKDAAPGAVQEVMGKFVALLASSVRLFRHPIANAADL